jgi:protein ImuA
MMRESPNHPLRRLQGLAGIALSDRAETVAHLETGHAAFDAALGGGLARGRLHELFAPDADDAASATGFAAMLALRALEAAPAAPLLWLRTGAAARQAGTFHAPGLAELGGDPARLLLAEAPDAIALLRCANDAARCPGLAAAVIETWGPMPAFDLTASRRLALAARDSGVTLLMLRLGAEPVPSAAETRWGVSAAPSQALEAKAPGSPAIEIELLRWRAGPAGMRRRMEWDRDVRCFREPALPGAVVPFPVRRALADRSAAALRRTA